MLTRIARFGKGSLSKLRMRPMGMPQQQHNCRHVASTTTTTTTRTLSNEEFESLMKEEQETLFATGPLLTSNTVKEAMLKDFGSRDSKFVDVVQSVRQDILDAAELDNNEYSTILMQGPGSFCIESVIQSVIPTNGRLLIISNGIYGERAYKMCKSYLTTANIVDILRFDFLEWPDLDLITNKLLETQYTHIFMAHSESTQGILNPVTELRKCIYNAYNTHNNNKNTQHNMPSLIIDAMSSFGGHNIIFDYKVNNNNNKYSQNMMCDIDYLITNANKCLQGVPGFGIIIARRDRLHELANIREQGLHTPQSMSLDLYEQWLQFEKDGQFRYTPATHTVFALKQAMIELFEEGGIKARSDRYELNKNIIVDGLCGDLGFELLLKDRKLAGHISTSFMYPSDSESWDFDEFYERLAQAGYVICSKKISMEGCFRIGHIGHIYEKDSVGLVKAAKEICKDMRLL